MNKLNVINRYLVDHDEFIFDGLSLINNKSWFVKLFRMFTKYEGGIKRIKSKVTVNNKMVMAETLIISYFIKGEVNSFVISIENGILRPSDVIHNEDFDWKIDKLFSMICKFNTYNKFTYKTLVNSLKRKG